MDKDKQKIKELETEIEKLKKQREIYFEYFRKHGISFVKIGE